MDDLAFSTFILGDIFTKAIETDRSNLTHTFLQNWILQSRLESSSEPLYSKFRRQYTDIWSKNFEKSFRKSGFAPLYDLVSGIMKTFNVFNNFTEE